VKAVKRTRAAAWIVLLVLAMALYSFAYDARRTDSVRPSHDTQAGPGDVPAADVLKQIYIEVKELGPYPGEDIIRQDFFLGPADDDSYKKEHVVVLIQVLDGAERMKIQVTEMLTRPDNPRIQLAGKARTITCSITKEGGLTVLRSDYTAKEIARVAPDVLRAVRDKKKLLKELGAKAPWTL
jgi:hypothetical protein